MKMPLDDPNFVINDQEYLENKNRGGKSSRKGFQFEMRYGAWELIKLAVRVVTNELDPFRADVVSQIPCYIDDLVIEECDLVRHFEMKSGETITWGDVNIEKTLSWNFKRQHDFNTRHGQNAEYTLVLAEIDRYQFLEPKAPQHISVVRFPFTYVIQDISAAVNDFVPSVSEILKIERKNAMLALIAGHGRLFYKFDRNDIYVAYVDFNAVYDGFEAATPRSLHDALEDAVLISRGNIPYKPKDISPRLRAKLLEIDGIVTVETCEGSLFLKSRYGVMVRFPAGIGTENFRDFAAAVMVGQIADVNDVHEWANRA